MELDANSVTRAEPELSAMRQIRLNRSQGNKQHTYNTSIHLVSGATEKMLANSSPQARSRATHVKLPKPRRKKGHCQDDQPKDL